MIRTRLGWAACLALGMMAGSVHAEDQRYSVQDLQALQQSKSWDELMMHLWDVPPSQRNANWNRIVESACTRLEPMDGTLAQYCVEPLKAVLNSEPTNTDLAWKAGKWARLNLNAAGAIPFFAKAGLKAGDPRCKDPDVSLAVISGLGLPADSEKEIVQQSQKIAFDTCWAAVSQELKKELKPNSYISQNACPGLKKKGALSKTDAAKCAQ